MSAARVVRPGEAVRTVYGAGDAYRFLATGEHTNGAYFLIEGLVPPGQGPPPHIQERDEEMFYVLEGSLVFWVGDERRRVEAGRGTFLHVPRGVLHNFRNETDADARLLLLFAPAGIEMMFEKMAADPDHYESIGAEFGVTFPAVDETETTLPDTGE